MRHGAGCLAYLDVTGSTALFGSAMDIAEAISERVKFELGITVSIGVSDNKITAKLGSDYKKPDAKEMQKEYVFCAYLLRLLPAESTTMLDLEGALKLEFYKLEKTFKGAVTLKDESGVYEPAGSKGQASSEAKEPLEEVIARINQLFNGSFTDADRVMLYALHDRLKDDKKLRKIAKNADPKVFAESIFPKTFDAVAQDSYVEQTEAFTSLFENKSKYQAVMSALAEMLYREFNRE